MKKDIPLILCFPFSAPYFPRQKTGKVWGVWRIFPCMAIVLLLTACVGQINPILKKEMPGMEIGSKIPLKVALFIPEASRKLTVIEHPGCIDSITPAPFGEFFQDSAREVFSRVFSEISSIQSMYEAERGEFDAVLEATLRNLDWAFACALDNPNHHINAQGSLRVMDRKGKVVWQSKKTDQAYRTPHVSNVKNLNEDVGEYISKAILLLNEGWAGELINSPEFLQYARDRKTPPPQLEARPRSQPYQSPIKSRTARETIKIAVWDLVARETKAAYAQELTSILVSEITRLNRYEVYSQDNVRTLAGWTEERMKLGCTNTQCLTALGQMDVAKLVSGSVGKIGGTYTISLNLFDTQNTKAQNAVSEFCRSEDELIAMIQKAVHRLLAD